MVYVKKYQPKQKTSDINPNKDSITLEDAIERFHEYYNARSDTKSGRLKAKIGDIKYNKSPKRVLKPGQPGSAKYLHSQGPRTFDMEGVDFHPEDKKEITFYDAEHGDVTVKLLGQPKLKSTNETYSSHFKNVYSNRDDVKSGENLVNTYWDKKYKPSDDKGQPLSRPRRVSKKIDYIKKGKHISKSYFLLGKNELFYEYNGNIYYLDTLLNVYDHNHNSLGKLINMDKPMIDELYSKGYISLGKGNKPIWNDDIYQWEIIYEYTNKFNEKQRVKLDMKNMIVYDINTDIILGDWNEFLTKNKLNYSDLKPIDITKVSKTSEIPSFSEEIISDLEAPVLPQQQITKIVEPELKTIQPIITQTQEKVTVEPSAIQIEAETTGEPSATQIEEEVTV